MLLRLWKYQYVCRLLRKEEEKIIPRLSVIIVFRLRLIYSICKDLGKIILRQKKTSYVQLPIGTLMIFNTLSLIHVAHNINLIFKLWLMKISSIVTTYANRYRSFAIFYAFLSPNIIPHKLCIVNYKEMENMFIFEHNQIKFSLLHHYNSNR